MPRKGPFPPDAVVICGQSYAGDDGRGHVGQVIRQGTRRRGDDPAVIASSDMWHLDGEQAEWQQTRNAALEAQHVREAEESRVRQEAAAPERAVVLRIPGARDRFRVPEAVLDEPSEDGQPSRPMRRTAKTVRGRWRTAQSRRRARTRPMSTIRPCRLWHADQRQPLPHPCPTRHHRTRTRRHLPTPPRPSAPRGTDVLDLRTTANRDRPARLRPRHPAITRRPEHPRQPPRRTRILQRHQRRQPGTP